MDKILFYLKKCFTQDFANFNGRARREEFWFFYLANVIISVIVCAILPWLASVVSIVFLIQSLAVGARRLHDTGRSGWFLLLNLIPLVGTIILIVFWVQDGMPEANKWGVNPKSNA